MEKVMIQETTKELLLETDHIPRFAWYVHLATGDSLEDIFDFLDERNRVIAEISDHYFKHEWPKVQKQLAEFRDEIPEKERREMRRRYLLESIDMTKKQYLKTQDQSLAKKLKKLLFEAKVHLGSVKGITDEQILSARNYPLSELIGSKNLYALCPFHKEKTPSLYLKNNFYYCYGCGVKGDSIDLYMHLHGVSFSRAVTALSTL